MKLVPRHRGHASTCAFWFLSTFVKPLCGQKGLEKKRMKGQAAGFQTSQKCYPGRYDTLAAGTLTQEWAQEGQCRPWDHLLCTPGHFGTWRCILRCGCRNFISMCRGWHTVINTNHLLYTWLSVPLWLMDVSMQHLYKKRSPMNMRCLCSSIQ